MILWLLMALMTVLAIAAVLWPLLRRGVATRSGSDVVVYRDQLDEVSRDLAAGLIGKTEAEAARVEISRRLLAASEDAQKTSTLAAAPTAWRRWAVAVVSLALVPLGATGLYLRLGSPGMASEPLAARMEAPASSKEQSVEKLVAQVEDHLQKSPNDGRGWEVIAPVYLQIGRYSDAVNAWRNAIKLLGENADRLADLGEAMTMQADGVVTADAKAAFVRAITLDDTTVSAHYYLGIAAEQDGDRAKAAQIFRNLIAAAKPDAHWVGTVRAALARVESKPASSTRLPGPTPAEMLAAAQQPPAQQNTTINSMVDRLASELKKDGSNPNGWAQLVRSYKVLGAVDKQKTAIADARSALASDPSKLKVFEVALKDIESSAAPAPAQAAPPAAAAAPLPGPTPAQMLADANQSPMMKSDMVQGMVGRLAERLKKDGSDPKGWAQLVRSYKVMGEADRQKAAVADARKALASDPAKLKQFEAELKDIESGVTPPPAPAAKPPHGAGGPAASKAGQHDSATIDVMVERLHEKLKKSGDDPSGWLMLTRSYLTMQQKDKAMGVVAEARKALAANPGNLKMFDEALQHYKIETPK